MRLNAYLARAGVASRRKADELIKAGRVTVNGRPGELNTFVAAADRVEVDGRPVGEAAARLSPAAQARRRRDDRARPGRPADRRRPRPARAAGRPGRAARCRHHRSAAADERRGARPPARASALRGRQGVRGGRRRRPDGRGRCGRWPKGSSSRTAARRPRRRAGSARRGSSSRSTRGASTRSSACARPSATRCGASTGGPTPGSRSAACGPGEWRELTRDEVEALRAATRNHISAARMT